MDRTSPTLVSVSAAEWRSPLDEVVESHRPVLHILPYDLARGAQRYARALVDLLDSADEPHRILTLFASEPVLVRPDFSLDVPQGPLRRLGLDPRVVVRLRRELKRLRPTAVVAHGGESAKYTALAVGRRLPWIYYKIGTVHHKVSRSLHRGWHRFYTRRAMAVAAVSTDVAHQAQALVGDDITVSVIPNARDPREFSPTEERTTGPPRVIFVGHLTEGKRPDWFIEAVAEMRRRGMEVQATLVGGGPLEEVLRAPAESAGVQMLGTRRDVASLLCAADIFVFPSLAPGEGMPGVLIEAGLAGLATVSTRVPGAADVIEDGVSGLLVDVDDQAGLVEALIRLVEDEDLRRSMGRQARQRCLQMFTLEESARMWRELLGTTVARTVPPSTAGDLRPLRRERRSR